MSATRIQGELIKRTSGVIELLTSTDKLKLPLQNDATAPTLSFGDGDSGFYESVDDTIRIVTGSSNRIKIDSSGIGVASGGWIKYGIPTATIPSILVVDTDIDTGMGSAGADILSLIAGGVEGHGITEAAGLISHILTGNVNTPTTQTLTGAGAVDVVSAITHIVTTAANALTLADGTDGQHKFIVMKTDGGAGTLTPTNPGNFTTIVFDDVGDSAQLLFTNGKWHYMGGTATLG